MALRRVEALWSPNNPLEFATYCDELRLYRVQDEGAESAATDLPLADGVCGRLIGTLPSNVTCTPQHKLVSWQTNSHSPYHFAVGQNSGKILLVQYSGSNQPHPPSLTTLSPRNGRQCYCVCWNPTETQLLATGLDKARNDSSLVVWDVNRVHSSEATPLDRTRAGRVEGTVAVDDSAKALEFGHGEATSSVVWLPTQSSCLVAGMGNRFLRLFDTRDEHAAAQTRPAQFANHKAILGLSICPSLPNQLASFAEGSTVYIWDLRQFGKPMYSFTRSATIDRLSWLPTRPGCLSIVTREAPYLHLVDIPSLTFYTAVDPQQDVAELLADHLSCRMTDRRPYHDTKNEQYKRLIAVEWHPKRHNVALFTTITGQVKQFQVHDKMAMAWSAVRSLVYSSSEKLISAAAVATLTPQEVDISDKIRSRVAMGYGFSPSENVKLLKDDVILHEVWAWLQLCKEQGSSLPSNKAKSIIPGVCTVLGVDRGADADVAPSKRAMWAELGGVASGEAPPFPVYHSPQRNLATQLCGWSFGSAGQDLEDFIKREELGERYERAAAVAVFQGSLRRGIMTLTDGAMLAKQQGDKERASQLHLIALALSGYSSIESHLWYETCQRLRLHVRQPYLRAVFNFLSSNGRDDFKDVLNETEISLQDRTAFLCTYFEDAKLQSYISLLTKQLVAQGDISALFLTGLTTEGLSLLSNYVNKTGDVQTACLVAGQVMPFAVKDKRVLAWFQGYRDLLDQWQMWHERAIFDSQRKQLDSTFKPQKQASVTCHFCSKSITGDTLRQDRRGPNAAARKSSSCPSCRKPLPRCALCLLNMVASGPRQGRENGSGRNQSDQFGQWFTWCQCCRHGGHAHHMAQWFSTHEECPVTGCACHCYALDT